MIKAVQTGFLPITRQRERSGEKAIIQETLTTDDVSRDTPTPEAECHRNHGLAVSEDDADSGRPRFSCVPVRCPRGSRCDRVTVSHAPAVKQLLAAQLMVVGLPGMTVAVFGSHGEEGTEEQDQPCRRTDQPEISRAHWDMRVALTLVIGKT